MSPIAYVFILAGGYLIRQVMVGRAMETPGDLRDAVTALLNADMNAFGEVAQRRGTNLPPVDVSVAASTGGSTQLVNKVRELGGLAKGYRLGSTGPEYYDCSGLVWSAMRQLGLYDGPRFTTHVFAGVAKRNGWVRLDAAETGAVVCWPSLHMGVCTGGDQMFSARSVAKGIGPSSISGDSSYFGKEPVFYRVDVSPQSTINSASVGVE